MTVPFLRLSGVLALASLVIFAAACFSDRGQATAPQGTCDVPLSPPQFGSTVIVISGFAFTPGSVHIRAGGKVTWVNCETPGTPSHTTTADGGAWSSPLIDPGSTYTVSFNTPGTFAYHCTPHPFMTAEVVVE
jgi:plastocyanin